MSVSAYAEQFPWDKVDAAKRYLYLVKPWWARFGQKLKIVPVYQRPPEGKPYGSITSTDGGFRLYIDVGFASWAPLHLLAGAIEHEFQHHTRDSWNRLSWLSLDEWREWANICFDLEINGGIDHEARQIDMQKIRTLAQKSHVFVEYELDFWSVTEPPGIGEDAWLPRLMGLPDRLSAEEYLNILQMAKKDPPPPPQGESGEDENEPEEDQEQDSASGQSDPEQEQGETSSDDEGSSDESLTEDEKPDVESDDDHNQSDDASESENDEDSDKDGDQSQGDGDASSDENAEPEDGQQEESEADGDASSDDADEEGNGEESSDGNASESSGNGDGSPGSEDADESPSDSKDGETSGNNASDSDPKGLAETFAELKTTGDRRVWSAELGNPQDDLLKPAWKPEDRKNEKPLDRASIESAMIELEDDVREFGSEMGATPFGLQPGANMLQWVAKRRRVRGVDWQSRLNKLLSSNYTSAKVHGASDLSYTVRNPNQPEFGVILQGLHDYAPTVVVIQDVSGSMISNDGMNKSMSAFTDLCSKVLGRFNSPVTWVTVDAGIIDVGTASSWNKHQQKRWSYGFGGTEIAPAIEQVMTGKLVWKGKKYPKADLTIIVTDCIFEWPKRRPIRNGKLLVISVEPDRKKLQMFLPKWVDRKRELVIIEN